MTNLGAVRTRSPTCTLSGERNCAAPLNQCDLRRVELIDAVVGKLLHQAPLAGDDGGQIGCERANVNAQFRRVLCVIEAIR